MSFCEGQYGATKTATFLDDHAALRTACAVKRPGSRSAHTTSGRGLRVVTRSENGDLGGLWLQVHGLSVGSETPGLFSRVRRAAPTPRGAATGARVVQPRHRQDATLAMPWGPARRVRGRPVQLRVRGGAEGAEAEPPAARERRREAAEREAVRVDEPIAASSAAASSVAAASSTVAVAYAQPLQTRGRCRAVGAHEASALDAEEEAEPPFAQRKAALTSARSASDRPSQRQTEAQVWQPQASAVLGQSGCERLTGPAAKMGLAFGMASHGATKPAEQSTNRRSDGSARSSGAAATARGSSSVRKCLERSRHVEWSMVKRGGDEMATWAASGGKATPSQGWIGGAVPLSFRVRI